MRLWLFVKELFNTLSIIYFVVNILTEMYIYIVPTSYVVTLNCNQNYN